MMVPKAALPIPPLAALTTTSTRDSTMDPAAPPSTQQPRRSPPPTDPSHRLSRPDNTRSSTDPSPTPSMLIQGYFKDKDTLKDWARPSSSGGPRSRNRSPYSRNHLRSRSSGAAPPMLRAHSLPSPFTFDAASASTSTSSSGSASPGAARTPARTRSPFRPDEGAGGIESIQEDSELDLRPRSVSAQSAVLQPTAMHAARVPSGGRRRPPSPLANPPASQHPPPPTSYPWTSTLETPTPAIQSAAAAATPSSASASPSLLPQRSEKYNEAYPPSAFTPQHALHHHSSTSSMTSLASATSTTHPSTPTSARSRSPSISSLDTIEDEPEREVMESLKAAAEREEGDEEGAGRRRSLDSARPGGGGFGFARGRSERKRWSVCGGERRGDLDLETIWED